MLLITLGISTLAVAIAASTSTAGPSSSPTTACIHNTSNGLSYFWTKSEAKLAGDYSVYCDADFLIASVRVTSPATQFQADGWLLLDTTSDDTARNARRCYSIYTPPPPKSNPNGWVTPTKGPTAECTSRSS